jgi:hypothetical protein
LVRDIKMFAPHCEVPEQEHSLISNQKSA